MSWRIHLIGVALLVRCLECDQDIDIGENDDVDKCVELVKQCMLKHDLIIISIIDYHDCALNHSRHQCYSCPLVSVSSMLSRSTCYKCYYVINMWHIVRASCACYPDCHLCFCQFELTFCFCCFLMYSQEQTSHWWQLLSDWLNNQWNWGIHSADFNQSNYACFWKVEEIKIWAYEWEIAIQGVCFLFCLFVCLFVNQFCYFFLR